MTLRINRHHLAALALAANLLCAGTGLAIAEQTRPPGQGDKTIALLKTLITFDTSNAPGDTRALAEYLKSQFEPLGAEVDIIVAPNGKAAHFIARLRGDGSKKPVLLAAHADVVPVERGKWTEEPFAGVEKDGFVYGRGAMDFKGGLAVFSRAVMRLAEEKVPLARDVIFLAEADEEQGQFNTSWLAKNHWDKIDAEFALNEGGYVLQGRDGTVRQINVTTAEKLSVTFALKATGRSGHSSRPFPPGEMANDRLIAALAKLAAYDPGIKIVPASRAFFSALLPISPPQTASDIKLLLGAKSQVELETAGRKLVSNNPNDGLLLHALLRDTMVVTMIEAGIKPNVIPGDAKAVVNTRLLPGTTTDQMIAEIRRVIEDPDIEVSIVTSMSQKEAKDYYLMRTSVPASPVNTVLYDALERSAKRLWTDAVLVPTMFEAGTDATAWRERNVPVYGIYPYPLDDDILSRMHGNDERIGVEAVKQGTEWIYRTLLEVAKK
ncbi:M20/M25/M40 family metallo-hydrolase [Bradyrhizobium sp. CB1650]|uniref:M20/M25/M40 family metallo-hydrolase n=1 Tax=Bradyrhizobium sp. CB1650 TaxID=3039153 RepID=UPI002435A3D3|nr:M20/M25/M40 family metallo-hydrolase [Bradyrhizobium sp. CB1650]WGD49365.1 M20/M25/M40 family metallo-hydrolase [Bradyrhizobium sp. CB1650]